MFFRLNGKTVTLILFPKKGQPNIEKVPSSVPVFYLWEYSWKIHILLNVPIFFENKLISSSQAVFKLDNSCINQLLSIIYEIYSYLDKDLEARIIFHDISKIFDKVWHDGIIFKLTQNRISGNLLNHLCDFLNERKQQVVLNRQFSTWQNVNAGVTQSFILSLLLFLIYINALTDDLLSNAKLFVDDTSLLSVVHEIQASANKFNKDLERTSKRITQYKMNYNPDLTNNPKKSFLSRVKKKVNPPLLFCSIMPMLLEHLPKNTWEL